MVKRIKKITDLTPDTANVNRGTERGQSVIDWSLTELGAGRSIVADADGNVLAGNKTMKAAAKLKLPVRVVETDGKELVIVQRTDLRLEGDGPQREKARQLALADNRTQELSYEADIETLLMHAQTVDLGPLYRQDEIDAMIASLEPEDAAPGNGGDDFDTTPEETQTRVRKGDLWELGNHRLLCGDSTKAEDVARVMDGEKVNAVITSPPYNQHLGSQSNPTGMHKNNAWFKRLDRAYSDEMPEEEYQQWQSSLLTLWFDYVVDGGCCFYNHKHRYRNRRPIIPMDWIVKTPWELRQEIIWDRRCGVAANAGMFIPGDERIYWLEKTGHHKWNATGSNRTTVWAISPQSNNGDHVCPYPLEIVTIPVEATTDIGDLIGEPFGGSGTTLIACERTNRKARVIEIEPKYVNVILSRWEAETGKEAKLLERVDG